jgi:hypothetical protein
MAYNDPLLSHAMEPQTLRERVAQIPQFQIHPDDEWLLDEFCIVVGGQFLIEDAEMGGWCSLGRMILGNTPEGFAVVPLREGGPMNYTRGNLEVLKSPRPRNRRGDLPRGVSLNPAGQKGSTTCNRIYQATAPAIGGVLGRAYLGSYETPGDARQILDVYEEAMLGTTLDRLVGTIERAIERKDLVRAVKAAEKRLAKTKKALADFELYQQLEEEGA